jgi:chemotaxis protein MotB
MKTFPSIALVVALAGCVGCAGNKIKQQQARIDKCETGAGVLRGQVRDCEGKVAALQVQVKELDGQISDLDAKLKAQQERIDSLTASNEELNSAVEAKSGALSGKLAGVIKEKDELAKRLDAMQKDKISADRTRFKLKASLDKLSADLAATKAKLDELTAAAAAAQADKDKAQAQRSARLAKVHEDMNSLADAVLKEVQAEKAKIVQDGESISLTIQEPLLFKSQQTKITDDGVALLDRVGRALQALGPRAIRVEGHSDNSTIKWELFGSFTSHWDLSAARATAVARYLHEHAGLDPRQLTAAGFGEFRPVVGNDTPEGREANRRVVLVVSPVAPAP